MSSRKPSRPGRAGVRGRQSGAEAARRAAEQAALRRRERMRLIVLVVVLAVLLVGGGIGFQAWRTGRSPSAVPAGTSVDAPQPLTNGRPIVFGDAAAPVELKVYADFHCPHCADFEEEFGPTLTVAQDAGRLRIAVYPMSFIDEGSDRAANAMACATEAGFGQRYYRGLFANSNLVWSKAQLLELGELSTDRLPDSFRSCVAGAERTAWADAIDAAADADGVTGTPTLFLDGAPLPLAGLTPEDLRTRIDAKA
nr:thioredoxin domain-containing protein [uncultured Friedmanniella sp.]